MHRSKLFFAKQLSPAKLLIAQSVSQQMELAKWREETLEALRKIEIDLVDSMIKHSGHTQERHFWKTNNDLINRAKSPAVEAASGFSSKRVATYAIQENIKKNAAKVVNWLADSDKEDKKLTIMCNHRHPIGKGVLQGKH